MRSIDPTQLLAAVTDVHDRFLADRSGESGEVLDAVLRGVLELTGAGLGFIARVRPLATGPVLSAEAVHAVDPVRHAKLIEWLRETLAASARGETIPRPLAQLARATEPLVLDYEPRLPALDNLLAVPLTRHGRRWQPVAIVALANRSGGFDLGLADELAPLLGAIGTVLEAFQHAEARAAREAEFERSERRFRTFMDASPCVAYVTDAERRLVWVSRAFADQFRVDPRDAVGRREDELLPAGMAARGSVELLEPIVDASGEVRWWQGARFPIEGDAGEPLIGSLALDVTDNVHIAELLREREAALSEAQELARLGRWSWAPQTDTLRWDPGFERLCGRLDPPTGLDSLLALIHPNDVEPTRTALERLIREPSTRLTLDHRLLVDGEVRELSVVVRIQREGERGLVLVAVAQDVGDRRRLERSRRELERDTQQLASLAVVAGGVAHELDQLFTSIVGNAGIALDELDPDGLAAACTLDIVTAAERGVELTARLQALATRGRSSREQLELSEVVTSVTAQIHASVASVVGVRLALDPELPAIVGDRAQLRQLILSLVTNASEAIGEGPGELTIATGWGEFGPDALLDLVDHTILPPGRYVWLEVHDTGPGVDAATRARMFEPYVSTRAIGRGLGLTAALAIVRGHAGGLSIASDEGLRVRALFPV